MKSCLYSCEIYHKRTRPKSHAFKYKLFTFCVDLDELEQLDKVALIGINRSSIYSLRSSDHYHQDAKQTDIKTNILQYIREQGNNAPIGQIKLITHLRTFGYQFNPVSFYFAYSPSGKINCAVAEVANTYNEQKMYYLPHSRLKNNHFRDTQIKQFYISPFSDLETSLIFDLCHPGEDLSVHINESDSEGVYFYSGMTGKRVELTSESLILNTLRFPWVTAQVILSIHWQALKLFLKKVPVRRKSDNPELQTNTRTYLNSKKKTAKKIV